MDSRTNVVAVARQSQLLSAHASARNRGALQDDNLQALLGQSNGGGKAIRAGSHNHRIVFVRHRGPLRFGQEGPLRVWPIAPL